MTVRKQLWISIIVITILTVLSAIVSYPSGPDITWKGQLVREIKVHLGLDLQGGTSLVYQADVSNIPETEQADAMAGVRDVLERRINAFGVSEPLIQTNRAANSWRVLVELPGITDVEQAVKEIGETPLLEFKVESTEVPEEQLTAIRQLNEESKATAEDLLQRALSGEDFATLARTESKDPGSAIKDGDLGYFTKGDMVQTFSDAAFAGTAGEVYPTVVESEFGYHIIKVTDHTTGVVADLNAGIGNTTTTVEDGTEPVSEEAVRASHILIQKIPEDGSAFGPTYENTELTGKYLKHSSVQFDSTSGVPLVSLEFDSDGAKLFEDITRDHIGETVAIYLDGEAISTPQVNEVISGGQAVIEGDFTHDEANQLAQRLNAGALPVKIELVNQRTIGPTLGVEAIQQSVVAGFLGLLFLAFFMIVYYRWPGFISVIALTIYSVMLLAIFKLWPITLTLSGIAGFILSLGMAVDANVLIFERLKEELRKGKSLQSAIDDGFKRAWLSIRDSNVSSLITCLILTWFGTSVIKGFAVTLAIGIALSMFSAITITRTLLKLLPVRNKKFYGVKEQS